MSVPEPADIPLDVDESVSLANIPLDVCDNADLNPIPLLSLKVNTRTGEVIEEVDEPL